MKSFIGLFFMSTTYFCSYQELWNLGHKVIFSTVPYIFGAGEEGCSGQYSYCNAALHCKIVVCNVLENQVQSTVESWSTMYRTEWWSVETGKHCEHWCGHCGQDIDTWSRSVPVYCSADRRQNRKIFPQNWKKSRRKVKVLTIIHGWSSLASHKTAFFAFWIWQKYSFATKCRWIGRSWLLRLLLWRQINQTRKDILQQSTLLSQDVKCKYLRKVWLAMRDKKFCCKCEIKVLLEMWDKKSTGSKPWSAALHQAAAASHFCATPHPHLIVYLFVHLFVLLVIIIIILITFMHSSVTDLFHAVSVTLSFTLLSAMWRTVTVCRPAYQANLSPVRHWNSRLCEIMTLRDIVRYYVTLWDTVWHCEISYDIVRHCATWRDIVRRYVTLCDIVLHVPAYQAQTASPVWLCLARCVTETQDWTSWCW